MAKKTKDEIIIQSASTCPKYRQLKHAYEFSKDGKTCKDCILKQIKELENLL